MIYLACFALSAVIVFTTERQQKNVRVAGVIAAIAILALFATVRDEKVGIDVTTYVKPLYLCAMRSGGLSDFFSNMQGDVALAELDYGYAFVGYVVSKCTRGLWGLFLANELFCIVPVVLGIDGFNRYLKESGSAVRIPYWAAMFIYLCLFYNNSLNQVRQIIVCGILFYCISAIFNKKYFRSFLWFAIACTFHVSAVIFLYILAVWIICKRNMKKTAILLVVLLAVFLVFSVQIFRAAMNVARAWGLIPEKYIGEIFNVEYGERNVNLSWLFVGLIMTAISGTYCCYNRQDGYGRFVFLMSLSFLSLFNFSSYYVSFGRVQLYFLIYAILILPLTPRIINGGSLIKSAAEKAICILIPLAYWFVAVYLLDYTGTIPYVLGF